MMIHHAPLLLMMQTLIPTLSEHFHIIIFQTFLDASNFQFPPIFSPVVNIAASLGHGPYAVGYQTAFDSGKSGLTKHNIAANYNAGDMILHCSTNDLKVSFINIFNNFIQVMKLNRAF